MGVGVGLGGYSGGFVGRVGVKVGSGVYGGGVGVG